MAIVSGSAASSAPRQQADSDADLLSNTVMPGLRALADEGIGSLIEPYAACYAAGVETSDGAALLDDRTVLVAEQTAQQRCATVKEKVMRQTDAALATRSPSSSPMVRAATLRSARRQAALFALIARYRDRQRGAVFQRYLTRIGSAVRHGRAVARLSGE